jgi:hypothetical protein
MDTDSKPKNLGWMAAFCASVCGPESYETIRVAVRDRIPARLMEIGFAHAQFLLRSRQFGCVARGGRAGNWCHWWCGLDAP